MHLFVDISSHGYGHLAQTAPVLNALRQQLPELRLTLRCGLPRDRIARRIAGDFNHLDAPSDFGLVMKNALEVDHEASLSAYQAFHADWNSRIEREAATLLAIAPDLLLSNVSYLALAGARRANIPAIAMCSLNWADIAEPYFRGTPSFAAIHSQMLAAYQDANAFLRLTPGMDMTVLGNALTIGPVAQPGTRQRHLLPQDVRLVLVAMGGVDFRLPQSWPRLEHLVWIVPRSSGLVRDDVIMLEETGLSASDLIASADCVISKAGYGTFVEAAASGTPLMYVERPDWPEEDALIRWLRTVGNCARISRSQFEQGAFAETLEQLMAEPSPRPVALTGIAQAVGQLAAWLTLETH